VSIESPQLLEELCLLSKEPPLPWERKHVLNVEGSGVGKSASVTDGASVTDEPRYRLLTIKLY
jgi:hypothetical protein